MKIIVGCHEQTHELSWCGQDSIQLTSQLQADTIIWSTGDTASSIWINSPGIYLAQTTIYGCTYTDTFDISLLATNPVNLGPDTTICSANGFPFSLSTS